MSDEQLTTAFQMLTLIGMVNAMGLYADAAESFEASFISAFSVFIESVLGAAAISIAFPSNQTRLGYSPPTLASACVKGLYRDRARLVAVAHAFYRMQRDGIGRDR